MQFYSSHAERGNYAENFSRESKWVIDGQPINNLPVLQIFAVKVHKMRL